MTTSPRSFVFPEVIFGLPDSAYSRNGKIEEARLRQRIKLSRAENRFLNKKMCPKDMDRARLIAPVQSAMVNMMADPCYRKCFLGNSLHRIQMECISEVKDTSLPQSAAYGRMRIESWDLMTLYEYAPDIWQFCCNNIGGTSDVESAGYAFDDIPGWVSNACVEIKDRACSQMTKWENLPEDKREILAEVHFALSFFLGSNHLTKVCFSQSALLPYYSSIRKLKVNAVSEIEDEGDSANTEDSRGAVFSSAEEIYKAVESVVEAGRTSPSDGANAQRLLSLAQKLVKWIEENPAIISLSEEAIPLFAATLANIGKGGGVLDNERDRSALLVCWREHLASDELVVTNEDAFVKVVYAAATVRDRVKQPLTDLKAEVKEIDQTSQKLESFPGETRSERRDVERQKLEIAQKRQIKINHILDYEEELLRAILPPGQDLETWEREEFAETKAVVDAVAVEPGITAALQKVYALLREDTEDFVVEYSKSASEPETTPVPASEPEPESKTWLEREWKPESVAEPRPVLESERETESEIDTEPELPPQSEVSTSVYDHELADAEIAPDARNGLGVPELDTGKPTDLQADGMEQLEENGVIDSELINIALCKHLNNGNLGHAAMLAKLVEDMDFATGTIPANILRSAYYGQNVWAYDRSLFESQQLLYKLYPAMIDVAIDVRSGGKAVPFLVLVASLQSALFGGNQTNAASLMQAILDVFDSPVQRLIKLANDISMHGTMLTLADLRKQDKTDHAQTSAQFHDRIDAWEKRITESRRGYAPIRKAQTYCLEHDIFGKIVDILRGGSEQDLDEIQGFIQEYRHQDASDRLLDEAIRASRSEMLRGEVFSSGKAQFFYKVEGLVELCQQWVNQKKHTTSDIQNYCSKLRTLLIQCRDSFRRISDDNNAAPDRRAGANVAFRAFNNIVRVIDGSDSVIWPLTRAKSWFEYPYQLVRFYDFEDDPVHKLSWLLGQADAPIAPEKVLDVALERKVVSLASLMHLYLKDNGDDRKRVKEEIDHQFINMRNKLRDECNRLIESIKSAVMADRLTADRSTVMLEEIESTLDQILSKETHDPVYSLEDVLDRIRQEVSKEIGSRLKEMRREYLDAREQIQEILPENPVPDAWVKSIETAFNEENLLVVDEMLSEIQSAVTEGRPISDDDIDVLPILDEFLACDAQLYDAVKESTGEKDLWAKVMNADTPLAGLDFSRKFGDLKKVIECYYSWRSKKPPQSINDTLFRGVGCVLELAGLSLSGGFNRNVKDCANYASDEGFASFFMKVQDVHPSIPFPVFGAGDSRPVIIAFKDWSPIELKDYMVRTDMTNSSPIVISVLPLLRKQRYELAHRFRQDHIFALHIDLVMALYLGTLPRDAAGRSAIANFLWATVPWTYFNPYVKGDTRYPPPPEMRFGREREITNLMEMNNGAAIVFGGRQLGKSTILQQVQARFHHNHRKQYAFYESMDKSMDRTEITKKKWESTNLMVWKTLHQHLSNHNLVGVLGEEPDASEIQQSIEKSLQERPHHKVIMIFDEVDPILNLDSAYDFGIIRGFRDLVCKPGIQGRFKLIIAGLENVKRFEASANNPLQQLGSPLQVSIMSTRDAQHMLNKPAHAAGYRYKSDRVINQILIETNRHPGLLQIFMHELISTLAKRQRGNRLITVEDVRNVKSNRAVVDLIRNRFELTLNLDRRYLVIVYGLLSEDKGVLPFTPKEAKEIAAGWLPSEFESLTTSQFIAYLDELVGLGVLKLIQGDKQVQYQLRNANIRDLIGGDDEEDVDSKLNQAIKQQVKSSPMDRHAFFEGEDGGSLCPITFRDEKGLFGIESGYEGGNYKIPVEVSPNYTVSIILGSPALGIKNMGESVRRLYQAEQEMNLAWKGSAEEYELFELDDAAFNSPSDFERRLSDVLIKRALEKPYAVVVNVTGDQPLAHVAGMIDAAHNLHSKNIDPKISFPVRVVFCLSPKAYWHWLSNPALTEGRELAQPFIKLAPWNESAVSHLLDKLDMTNSPGDVAKVMRYTGGWYISLDTMVRHKASRSNVHSVADLGNGFRSMTDIKSREAKRFLSATGLRDVKGVAGFVSEVAEMWEGDAGNDGQICTEEIEASYEDTKALGDDAPNAEGVIRWLSDMSIIRRVRDEDVSRSVFSLDSAVAHALSIVNVDE